MSATASKPLRFTQITAAVLSVVLSSFVGFMAQASTPDYRSLFWTVLVFVVVDAGLLAFVFSSKERRIIWLTLVPAFLGFASFLELACRVWLGFRVL
jgi:hypothetical protein